MPKRQAYILSKAINIIIQRFQSVGRENGMDIEDEDIFCYMDDLTVTLRPEYDAHRVAKMLEDLLKENGLASNQKGKAAAISYGDRAAPSCFDSWYPML